jgi:hypothetical protein
LAFYGSDQWITLACLTGGPPFMEIYKGCEQGYPGYYYDSSGSALVNTFFQNTLCQTGAVDNDWVTNSVEAGGNYAYPTCKVHIFIGMQDTPYIKNRGNDYLNLIQPGTLSSLLNLVPNTGHAMQPSPTAVTQYLLPSLINGQ